MDRGGGMPDSGDIYGDWLVSTVDDIERARAEDKLAVALQVWR